MKKFQVENAYRNADMIEAGEYSNITFDFIGDYIEANTAEEAIELAMDYIAEQVHANSDNHAEIKGDSIVVLDDDDGIVEEFYGFTATIR